MLAQALLAVSLTCLLTPNLPAQTPAANHIAQTHYVKASTVGWAFRFGRAVAVSGDTLVIGSIGEQGGSTGVNGSEAQTIYPGPGAAYVFRKTGNTWVQEAYLKASNTDAGDWFGCSVAIDGDTIVVGARYEDGDATGVGGSGSANTKPHSGAAYVYSRSGSTWSFDAYLKASNTGQFDEFGYAVAVAGDTIAVGAPFENSLATGIGPLPTNNNAKNSGAVYLFRRDAQGWKPDTDIKASNSEAGDDFGFSLALSGSELLVGALFENSSAIGIGGNQSDNSAPDSGAAYLFQRTGSTWSQTAYLKASNTDVGDRFGYAVDLDQDTLVVSAEQERSIAVDVNGDQSDNSGCRAGAAYVFERGTGSWSQSAYLKASNTLQVYDCLGWQPTFGGSVSLAGNRIFVGASNENNSYSGIDPNGDDRTLPFSGAVYGFERAGTTWSPLTYIKASNADTGTNPEDGDLFGFAVSVDGDTLVVGAMEEASPSTGLDGDQDSNLAEYAGAAYLFDLNASSGFFRYGADPMGSGPDLFGASPASGSAPFTFSISGFYNFGTGMLMISVAPANVPLLGGTLLVDASLSIVSSPGFVPVAIGFGESLITLPTSAALIGLPLFAQVAMFDSSPPAGLSLTTGLEIILGP